VVEVFRTASVSFFSGEEPQAINSPQPDSSCPLATFCLENKQNYHLSFPLPQNKEESAKKKFIGSDGERIYGLKQIDLKLL